MATQAELIEAGWKQDEIDAALAYVSTGDRFVASQSYQQEDAQKIAIKAMLAQDPLAYKATEFGTSDDLLATQNLVERGRDWANITNRPLRLGSIGAFFLAGSNGPDPTIAPGAVWARRGAFLVSDYTYGEVEERDHNGETRTVPASVLRTVYSIALWQRIA